MQNEEILKSLEEIISKILSVEIEEFKETTIASNIDGWDSLNHLKIILAIEEAFCIEFEIDDITSFENIGDLINKISELKGA